jgi:hypothetical protein
MKDALNGASVLNSDQQIYVQLVVLFRICFMLFHRYRRNFIKKIIKHNFSYAGVRHTTP